jgi:alpha-beta hydrolase superfamily lysophospholipase
VANLALLHGYGDHCGRYDHVARAFNASGITVHSFDQCGHGRSPGRRAFIRNFARLEGDLDQFLQHILPLLGDKPFFMMGHSMGGLLLARYAELCHPDVTGLIFSSPFLAFSEEVPKILLALAPLLGTVLPWMPVGGVDNAGLSRDPAVIAAGDNDPLGFHGNVRACTGAQFYLAIQAAHEEFAKIDQPMIVFHGSGDKVVNCAGSRALYDGCQSKDKTLRIVEGGYHELWNDLCKEEVIGGMCDWMLNHCALPAKAEVGRD